jgi:hypothetical protein
MKHLLKIVVIGLILIAGLSSCTYGTFEGTGGVGNLLIANIPRALISTKSVTYSMKIETPQYKFDPEMKKITGTKLSAPLYDNTTVYTAGGSIPLTFVIYKDGTEEQARMSKSVTFYDGSGLVEWKTP